MGPPSASPSPTRARARHVAPGGLFTRGGANVCEVEARIDTEHTPSVMPEALARRLDLVWGRRETWRPDGHWGEAEVTEPVQVELFGRPATIEVRVMGEQVRLGATMLTSSPGGLRRSAPGS